MSDVSYPGDILVVGQRRAEGGTYPTRGGTSGGGGDTGGPQQNEVGMEDPNPDQPYQPDPCAQPSTKQEWDADAAAAQALRDFLEKAMRDFNEDGLYREYFAFLYRDGEYIRVGRVQGGEVNWVQPELDAVINVGNLIGFIHNHPSGGRSPSGADWGLFNYFRQMLIDAQVSPNHLRQYMVGRDVAVPTSQLEIRVYVNESSHNDDALGPEVNKNGEPCSVG